MSDNTPVCADELNFGEALRELEAIVGALESGSLELEESLERYGRGVELLKSLQGRLAEAQQKVTMLLGELESEAGTVEEGEA